MKKKIIFIIPDLEIGGAQNVLVYLANNLAEKGFNIEILVFKNFNKKNYNLFKSIKVKSLSIYGSSKNIFQKIISNINRLLKLRIEIRRIQPNIIISFLTTANILALISTIGLKRRIIVNERNDLIKKKLNYSWKILRIIFYRYANRIIINLPNARKNFFFTNLNKTIFIPNPNTFNFSKKRIKKEKIILTVARLTHQKNIEILIKSFSKSIALQKKWKLMIIGEGENKKELYRLVKELNLFKFVVFKKKIKKLDTWYKKASIFVLPSRYEGMPNVIIEALQCKTVIIGSNIAGIKFFIKNKSNGILFNNNDENSLVKMINLLVSNPKLRSKLAQNGINSINKYIKNNNFLSIWENQVNKILKNEK